MQAAEKAKYIDLFNSPSFRECSTPDITVKENPALVRVVKGRICLFPRTFLASCNREYCSSRGRIKTSMDWKFGYLFSYNFLFIYLFFTLYVPLATPCPSLWDGNQIINSLFKIWNFFQLTESDCQRHFILTASI